METLHFMPIHLKYASLPKKKKILEFKCEPCEEIEIGKITHISAFRIDSVQNRCIVIFCYIYIIYTHPFIGFKCINLI